MTRRTVIQSLIEEQLAAANSRPREAAPERPLAGPVRAMSLTLDTIEEESRALRQALAAGAAVVEIDPAAIDASFVVDRLDAGQDAAFEALKTSIREHGQEVPVLVRPHPDREGRYQAAYGHRRIRAARDLGAKVRAVVRALSDAEHVVAQGLENSARRDLSFIERALFAKELEDRTFERPVIMAALSTDKTELSKMISVARALPESLVRAIGPAPKAGRRRWLELADLLREKGAARRGELALADPNLGPDSDARFLRVLASVAARRRAPAAPKLLRTPEGAAFARVSRDARATVVKLDAGVEPEFGDYLVARLGDLLAEFRAHRQ